MFIIPKQLVFEHSLNLSSDFTQIYPFITTSAFQLHSFVNMNAIDCFKIRMIYLPIDCAFSSFSVNFFIQSACVGRHPAFILCHTVRRVLKQTNKQTNQNPCHSVLFCKSIHQTPLIFHTANLELQREGHLESRIALNRQRRASRSNCSNSCQKVLQYFKLAQSSFNGQLQPSQSTN